MERRFRADFSGVRIHTDTRSAEATRDLNAKAFTLGSDIVFGAQRFQPQMPSGRALLAHELAHVTQQGGDDPVVRRQPDTTGGTGRPSGGGGFGGGGFGGGGAGGSIGGGSSGGGGAGRSFGLGGPGAHAAGRVAGGPVELKGTPRFSPSDDLAEKIKGGGSPGAPVWVNVRFGSVAAGVIPVYYGNSPGIGNTISMDIGPEAYWTPRPPSPLPAWGIPLVHPAFTAHPQAEPTLWIKVVDSEVYGAMGWATPLALAMDPRRFKASIPLELLFGGLGDFDDLTITGEIVNTLHKGRFRYEAEGLKFVSGFYSGSGRLRAADETYELDAQLDVPVDGLPSGANIPVRRTTTSFLDTVHATRTWTFQRRLGGPSGGRLSGSVTGVIGRGTVDVRGSASYASNDPTITGRVTVLVTSLPIAEENVRDHLGQDAPPSSTAAPATDRLAITGWGQLDFALSEWLTGNAEVIVHPEGYVTARGELLPTKVIGLFRQRDKTSEPKSWEVSKTITGLPWIAEITADAETTLAVYGWIGPGTLHDLRVTGLVSNHPLIVNRFDFGGTLGTPAAVGLKATAAVGLSARLLTGKVASARVSAEGELELQLYGEAAAVAGRRASPDPGKEEYFLKGHLEADAELVFKLMLRLRGDVPFWSPKLDLAERAWSIGSGAARADFEYVMGRKDGASFTASLDKVAFDPARFAEALVRKEMLTAKGVERRVVTDTDTTSEVVNPSAPTPAGPAPTGWQPPTVPAPGRARFEVTEPFTMEGVPHELTLVMIGEPDLQMASRRRSGLLARIDRVRKALTKLRPAPGRLEAQLAELSLIERQAESVMAVAEKVDKAAPYLTPSVPGFRELARLIEGYGVRYQASDLGVALADVSVDPQDPETVLHKFPDLAKRPGLTWTVSGILEHGVAATTLRKIVDNHRPSEEVELETLLMDIHSMLGHNVPGQDKVIADLAVGGNMTRGARWVLRYVGELGTWTDLTLEVHDADSDEKPITRRRWDALMGGTLYEFKWWYSWGQHSSRTFLRQINNDFQILGPGGWGMLRWIFGPSPLEYGTIIDEMREALLGVIAARRAGQKPLVDMDLRTAMFIEPQLERFVRKYR